MEVNGKDDKTQDLGWKECDDQNENEPNTTKLYCLDSMVDKPIVSEVSASKELLSLQILACE